MIFFPTILTKFLSVCTKSQLDNLSLIGGGRSHKYKSFWVFLHVLKASGSNWKNNCGPALDPTHPHYPKLSFIRRPLAGRGKRGGSFISHSEPRNYGSFWHFAWNSITWPRGHGTADHRCEETLSVTQSVHLSTSVCARCFAFPLEINRMKTEKEIWASPQNPSKFCFFFAKVLRECRGNSAEEFRNFDGIANFLFG